MCNKTFVSSSFARHIRTKHNENSKYRLKENPSKKVSLSKPGEYIEEDVKNEFKVEEWKVEVKESQSPSKGEKLQEDEVAEMNLDLDEAVEDPDPERLKKEVQENQMYLCPVGSCTFSLATQHIEKQQQHFKLFHPQLDSSQLRFLTL